MSPTRGGRHFAFALSKAIGYLSAFRARVRLGAESVSRRTGVFCRKA
jgi:hypothetical protein